MKAKKIIVRFVVVPLAVLLAITVLAFIFAGNRLIKTGIEVAGSKTLGVPVTVKGVNLSILRGRVKIDGLVVKNPPGYANETLLELGQGLVSLRIGSLMKDTIAIKDITLDGTKLTMEQKGLTNNLKEVLDTLPKEEGPAAEEKGKNLHIDRLGITDTNVRVKLLPVPGKADTVSLKVDPIVMTDLGTDKKLKIGTLTAKVIGAIATGVAKQGAGVLPDDMVKGIGSALGATAEIGKAAVTEGQKVLEETAGVGKSLIDDAKGLFGGKPKDAKKEPKK